MGILRKNDVAGLLFIGLFLVSVLIIAWIALERIQAQTKNNSREALQTVLRTTQQALHIWVEQRRRGVMELASLPAVGELTEALLAEPRTATALRESPYQKRLRNLMRPRLNLYSDKGFFVIAPDMISVASMRDENLGKRNLIHQQRPEYLQRLFQGEVIFIPTIKSDVALRNSGGQPVEQMPTIFVGSPIHNDKGEVIAVIVVRIDAYIQFIRITQLGRIGQSGETYAFDQQGRLITESRFDQQLRRTGLVEPDGRGILQIRITDPGGNLLEGYTASLPEDRRELTYMARQAVVGKSGFSVDGYRDYRGVQVFGAWLWDSTLGFGLTTEIDEAEALQPFYATRLIILAVLAATVALAFVLSSGLIWVRKQSQTSLQKAYTELEVRVDERTRELKNARDALEVANRKLAVQATTDPLTGLANRRDFDQHLEEEWSRCQRYRRPLSIIMLDIDHFKAYNDRYGHPAGDECLIKISVILRGQNIAARPGDMVARYGGEEFIILLSGTPNRQAIGIAEHINALICKGQIPHEASGVIGTAYVTASLGVATESDCSQSTPGKLIGRADEALYAAKAEGRNRVVSLEQPEKPQVQM
jgi:diguanylate cyclase (GGDEF)-like protein